jgi:predicted DNA binding protein
MPIIADLHVEHPDLVLTPTIRAVSDLAIEVVSHSSTDPETRLFSFLVRTADFEEFEQALDSDTTVGNWDNRADFGEGGRIYQITYGQDIVLISPKISEVGGLTLEAIGSDGGWNVRCQLPDRDAMASLYTYCNGHDIRLEVNEVYSESKVNLNGPTGLTEPQYETLVTAFESGYFKQPREITLDELAAELDISSTAAGGRLRRGMENLIETTLRRS